MSEDAPSNFIRTLIDEHLAQGVHQGVVTRFPPEPNGYLHIGHAKSICLNFGLARDYEGRCHLRFDDTNPLKEDVEYVEAIKRDIQWLGFDWGDHLHFASEYFDQFYEAAQHLIRTGKAYVCSQTEEEMRAARGTVTEPGQPSPDRDRAPEESLDLLARMKAGEFEDGEYTLRAKIDMASSNMKMRDPALYRIRNVDHHHIGSGWCIYPMYDFAHCISDSIERITHSICTLEFENNRELYDWILDHLPVPQPQPRQYEFARLNLEHAMMSKRRLRKLVEDEVVAGWDDPRMPTVSGYRRRGVRPEAIRDFAERVGVAKANSLVDVELLHYCIRDDLNFEAPRVMCVLEPLEVVITNYDGNTEWLDASYWPYDVPKEGTRSIPFSKRLYIEQADFMEEPVKGFKRLAPGREVRLRYGYYITCDEVEKDADGNVVRLLCSYDPATRGGSAPDGRKVKATLHWVSADESLPCQVRIYDHLFSALTPDAEDDPFDHLNPESLAVKQARIEPSVARDAADSRYQFERQGYFWRDPEDSGEDLVFNRIVALKSAYKPKQEQPAPQRRSKDVVQTGPRERSDAEVRDSLPDDAARSAFDQFTVDLPRDDAETIASHPEARRLYEEALDAKGAPRSVAKILVNDLMAVLKDTETVPFYGSSLAELAQLIDSDTITSKAAKTVLDVLVSDGGSAKAIVEKRGLAQLSSADALEPIVAEVLANHPEQTARLRSGEERLLGFFTGQVMKITRGRANPQIVQRLLRDQLPG